jgi:hypothetical protein
VFSIGHTVTVGTGGQPRKRPNWSQLPEGDLKKAKYPTSSQEHINKPEAKDHVEEIPMQIWKDVEVRVASGEVDVDLEAGNMDNAS